METLDQLQSNQLKSVEISDSQLKLKHASAHPTTTTDALVSCADVIVSTLEALGVEYVFGIQGGNIEPFYNALAVASRRKNGLKHVSARHEFGAVNMAHGYSRSTGRLGVVCTTTGPGATNTITGVASVFMNYVPLLVITAQTGLSSFGSQALQESSSGAGVDVLKSFSGCTRYNTLVSHPQQLVPKLTRALSKAFGPNPGPVHLSIPRDMFNQRVMPINHSMVTALMDRPPVIPDAKVVETLLALMLPDTSQDSTRSKGVIWVGGYAQGCSDVLVALAEQLQWSIAVTPMGKGRVPADHPLYIGVHGMYGHEYVSDIMSSDACHCILGVGVEIDEVSTGGWNTQTVYSSRLLQIADIPELLELPAESRLKVYASPVPLMTQLLAALQRQDQAYPLPKHSQPLSALLGERLPEALPHSARFTEELGKALILGKKKQSGPIHPRHLLAFLNQKLPNTTRVVMDNGNSAFWGVNLWRFCYDPTQTNLSNQFFIELHFAAMGWAIGTAVGAALATPSDPVLCVTGDGAYLMSGQEITVAVEHQLPVIYVVLNDNSLGAVKHGQRLAGAEQFAYELPQVSFAGMANAVGALGMTIHSLEDLRRVDFASLLARPGPTLLDVHIDPEAVPPLGGRVRALKNALTT